MQACALTLFPSTIFGVNEIILANPKTFYSLSKIATTTS